MNISFTSLHVPRSIQNKRNLKEIAANNEIKTALNETLATINKKSGDKDVYLRTQKRPQGLFTYPYYSVKVVDGNDAALSSVSIFDYRALGETHSDEYFSSEAVKNLRVLAANMPDSSANPIEPDEIFDMYV